MDYTIIEATAITEDGSIVPGPAVGASPEMISVSDKIIIEVNTKTPSFEGIHDIDMPVNPHSDNLILTHRLISRLVKLLFLLTQKKLLPLLKVLVVIKSHQTLLVTNNQEVLPTI